MRFDLVKAECEDTVVESRIRRFDGIRDADFDVHLHFKEQFDGIDGEHLVVDNSGSEGEPFTQVDRGFE